MLDIIILAVIQALTEFIPVSSSGHLLATEQLTSIESSLAVDVVLHFGTLIALVIYFWPKLMELLTNLKSRSTTDLVRNIVITTIPAVLAGFFFEDFFENDARRLGVVIVMLVSVGILMILSDKLFKLHNRDIAGIRPLNALIIGLGQAIALIPGTSRSGIAMLSARSQGLNNKDAAEYSFLVGIPVIFGATVKTLFEGETREVLQGQMNEVIVGVIVAAVIGLVALRFMLRYLSQNGLAIFGWYRVALAAVLLVIWINQ